MCGGNAGAQGVKMCVKPLGEFSVSSNKTKAMYTPMNILQSRMNILISVIGYPDQV